MTSMNCLDRKSTNLKCLGSKPAILQKGLNSATGPAEVLIRFSYNYSIYILRGLTSFFEMQFGMIDYRIRTEFFSSFETVSYESLKPNRQLLLYCKN